MGLVLELINPLVLERVDEFRDRFQSAKPFHHVVIDQLLAPEHCRRLVEEFPSFNPQQARNEFGEAGGVSAGVKIDHRAAMFSRVVAEQN